MCLKPEVNYDHITRQPPGRVFQKEPYVLKCSFVLGYNKQGKGHMDDPSLGQIIVSVIFRPIASVQRSGTLILGIENSPLILGIENSLLILGIENSPLILGIENSLLILGIENNPLILGIENIPFIQGIENSL